LARRSRGLGDVYKRQVDNLPNKGPLEPLLVMLSSKQQL
jgi:hypothetical protein